MLPIVPPKRVLIVDDEAAIRRVCRDYLARNGYEVITAPNGVEALRLLSESALEVSLAILDLMMPFMDGQALMMELKRFNPELKCVASSGSFADDDLQMIEALLGQGFDGVLAKPFTCEKLHLLVDQQLSSVQAKALVGR